VCLVTLFFQANDAENKQQADIQDVEEAESPPTSLVQGLGLLASHAGFDGYYPPIHG